MPVTIADSKRRVVLPQDVINEMGRKFVVVRLPDEVLLKPLPAEPLKALQKEGKKMKLTARQLEKEVEKYAKRRVR